MQMFPNFPAKRLSTYRKKKFVTPFNQLNDYLSYFVQYIRENKEYNNTERTLLLLLTSNYLLNTKYSTTKKF